MSVSVTALTRPIFAAMLVFAAATPAGAQSLRDLRTQDAEQVKLTEEANYTSAFCRMPLLARIDWPSASNWPGNVSLAASCDGALGALEWICKTPDGRARAKRIARFVCAGDGTGPSLSGDALRFGANPGGNGFSATKVLLEENL